MRISDWSSDVCSSDLDQPRPQIGEPDVADEMRVRRAGGDDGWDEDIPVERLCEHEDAVGDCGDRGDEQEELDEAVERSEEHTSELQSLMRISYAVFCLKKKRQITNLNIETQTE